MCGDSSHKSDGYVGGDVNGDMEGDMGIDRADEMGGRLNREISIILGGQEYGEVDDDVYFHTNAVDIDNKKTSNKTVTWAETCVVTQMVMGC